MAAKVHRRIRVDRTQFRDLRNGSVYYLAADNTGPFVKCDPRCRLNTNALPLGATFTPTSVTNVGVTVIKISKFTMDSQNAA